MNELREWRVHARAGKAAHAEVNHMADGRVNWKFTPYEFTAAGSATAFVAVRL